jgi:hypothetical protein
MAMTGRAVVAAAAEERAAANATLAWRGASARR